MPKPTSARQYRFLQAVAHGTATKPTSLTPGQAKAGLAEASHAERSKFARAGKAKHVIRLKRKRKGGR
jgi:hypothetical protein